MTALTTLYAAHKYMCPGLAKQVSNWPMAIEKKRFKVRLIRTFVYEVDVGSYLC